MVCSNFCLLQKHPIHRWVEVDKFIGGTFFGPVTKENEGKPVSTNDTIFKYLASLRPRRQSHLKDNHEFPPIKIIRNIQTAFDSRMDSTTILILRPFRIVPPVYLWLDSNYRASRIQPPCITDARINLSLFHRYKEIPRRQPISVTLSLF